MKRGGRVARKLSNLPSTALSEAKLSLTFQSRSGSLPQIHPDEGGDLEADSDLPLNRTATIEGGKQGSKSGLKQVPRGLYTGQVRLQGDSPSKARNGLNKRSNSQADISFQQIRGKRNRKTGLSMQLDSGSIALLRRTETGIKSVQLSHHFPKSQPPRSATPDLTSDNMETDLAGLKEALLRALGAVPVGDLRAQMKVYHIHFVEVMRLNEQMSEVLELFQQGYEGLFQDLQGKYNFDVGRLQAEVINLQSAILREASDRKTLLTKIDKLSRENVEISSTCQSYEEKLTDYQEKLFDIANVPMDHYPPSKQAWQVVNSEVEYYHTWKRKAEREMKILQVKEKKLIKLVHALKSRGYPVEEVYTTEVKTPAPSAHSADIVRDENESQRLVSGRPKSMPKPVAVPSLELQGVEPDLSSEEGSVEVPAFELSLGRTISGISTQFMTDDQSPINHESADHQKAT